RTKTYVVEISPLGLVEMTRQNVTDGPREILTKKCPVCEGDGIVVSDVSVAIDVERKLRGLASASRHKAFKVAVNDHVAGVLIGSGATRLSEIEAHAKRRFVLEPRTAEGQAEKPTRTPPAKRTAEAPEEKPEAEAVEAPAEEPVAGGEVPATDEVTEAPKPKKKTRRGSRGGRGRKKKPVTEIA